MTSRHDTEANTRTRGPSTETLTRLLYTELYRMAERLMRKESPGHTLSPTALVHEAYLRLARQDGVEWGGRLHFLALAATMMRRALVDHARKKRQRREGETTWVEDVAKLTPGREVIDILDLDEALTRLAEHDQREGLVVELRFFTDLKNKEIAEVLNVSERTVRGDWEHARAWLRVHLEDSRRST